MNGLFREGCAGTNKAVVEHVIVPVRKVRKLENRLIVQIAAERSIYSDMSVSLCGIKEEKKENNYLKEVKREASSVIYLAGRSRERFAPDYESSGVNTFVIRPVQQRTDDYEKEVKGKGKDRRKVKGS